MNPVKNYASNALLDVPIDPATDANNKRVTLPKSKQLTTKHSNDSYRDNNVSITQNVSNRGSQELNSRPGKGLK